MDTYSLLRQIADSWVLLALTLFFLGTVAWAFRPGSRPLHDDAAQVPFRHDEVGRAASRDDRARAEARDPGSARAASRDPGSARAASRDAAPGPGCGRGCADCTCDPAEEP